MLIIEPASKRIRLSLRKKSIKYHLYLLLDISHVVKTILKLKLLDFTLIYIAY
jgi:hypothetical protein